MVVVHGEGNARALWTGDERRASLDVFILLVQALLKEVIG